MKTEKFSATHLDFLLWESYFSNDQSQNYLPFQTVADTFKILIGGNEEITAFKPKALSKESIRYPDSSGNSLVQNEN